MTKEHIISNIFILPAYLDSKAYHFKQYWSFLHIKTSEHIISNIIDLFCISDQNFGEYYFKHYWSVLHIKTSEHIISNIIDLFCILRLNNTFIISNNIVCLAYVDWRPLFQNVLTFSKILKSIPFKQRWFFLKNILYQTVLTFSAYYDSRTYYFKQYYFSFIFRLIISIIYNRIDIFYILWVKNVLF